MKKVFMMLIVAAGCMAMTSCRSDVDKAVDLTKELGKATMAGDTEKIEKITEELKEIEARHQGDKDFEEEYKQALIKAIYD